MSSQFWLDSSGRVGFGLRAPTEQIHSVANVRADGLMLGQMGSSGQVAQAPTTPYVTTVGTPVGSASPWTLATYVLPASALSAINKGVRLSALGTYASNAVHKFVMVNFGGIQILTSGEIRTPTGGGGNWFLEASVLASGTSPATQVAAGMMISQPTAPGAAAIPTSSYTVATAALSSAITISVSSSVPSSTDVTLSGFSVDFIN